VNGNITITLASIIDNPYLDNFDSIRLTTPGVDSWIDGKVFNITNTGTVTVEIDDQILSNVAWQTHRTANVSFDAVSTVTLDMAPDSLGSTEGIQNGDFVYLDGFPSTEYQVFNVNFGAGTFEITEVAPPGGVDVVDFRNYGAGGNAANKVQIVSSNHGLYPSASLVISDSDDVIVVPDGATSVETPLTSSTFYLSSIGVSANVAVTGSYDLDEVAISNVTHQPIARVDMRTATNIREAAAVVNSSPYWVQLNPIPDTSNQVYLSVKPQFTSAGFDFTIFEDPIESTLSELALIPGTYTRAANTVKAKLENWMGDLLVNNSTAWETNFLDAVSVAVPYTDNATFISSFDTYQLDQDFTLREIYFNSQEEARNFVDIVNGLYFETYDSDVRGLVNLKTNIEIRGRSDLGEPITTIPNPGRAFIAPGINVVPGLTQSTLGFDSYFIDYTITKSGTDDAQLVDMEYQRIGTLKVTSSPDFGGVKTVSYEDQGSDSIYAGAGAGFDPNAVFVNFEDIYLDASDNLLFVIDNQLPASLLMKFSLRRWDSSPFT